MQIGEKLVYVELSLSFYLDLGTLQNSANTLAIPSPLLSADNSRGSIPLSSAITTVIGSNSPLMMQNLSTPQHFAENGITLNPQPLQQQTFMSLPSVTLRTLVLDLLGMIYSDIIC